MATETLDYLIIGAGPAGLAFAGLISRILKTDKFRIIDLGKAVDERKHDNVNDLACGAGGAGCYSDGKFSYFPAGTNVWKLCYPLIIKAYQDLKLDLEGFSADSLPEFPTEEEVKNYFFDLEDQTWMLKKYPTIYIDLDHRKKLIQSLVNKILAENVSMNTKVVRIVQYGSEYQVYLQSFENNFYIEEMVNVKTIIFAGGRFFPLQLLNNQIIDRCPTVFRRYEFGVRIQTPASNQVMIGLEEFKNVIDPKFRYKYTDGVEFRTFCWCRNGETVLSDFNGLQTWSGRSDCVPTILSNFGFLVRITNPTLLSSEDFSLISHMKSFDLSIKESSRDFLISNYGALVGDLLFCGLTEIFKEFPQLVTNETRLMGPTIEGVGYYPQIDHNLKIPGHNIYCLGDTTGTFRGIIPCMISGYYLAHSLKYAEQMKTTFITGNKNKAIETQQILGPIAIKEVDLLEFQGTSEEIAIKKCQLAAKLINGPVIVEDTSLCFNSLGGLPGPYIKWFMDGIGCEGLYNLLEAYPDKTGYVKCIVAYAENAESTPILFVGITEGTIVKPRGTRNFGWDPIFQPDGYSLTYAEIDHGAKNKVSHRYRALSKLKDYFELQNSLLNE